MTAVVFYFQVHQPDRLRSTTAREAGGDTSPDTSAGTSRGISRGTYWDVGLDREVLERVAERCYLPMNRVLQEEFQRTDGRFRVSFSLSGTVLSQLETWAPAALASFQELVATGAAEVLCETSMHSLASLGDPDEFVRQVEEHRERIRELFGCEPTTFRNTELILDEPIAAMLEELGFEVVLAEGADGLLAGASPQLVYRPRGCRKLVVLLRSYAYSDDIAFRFSDRRWPGYPLMADTFAGWLDEVPSAAPYVGLFMDYETFGEHQAADTGIFEFMRFLPRHVLENPRLEFATPREVARRDPPAGELGFPRAYSWADEDRDLSAWLGNPMQRAAHEALYALGPAVRATGDPQLAADWRKLTTSDHVYYMATKTHSDAEVHEYFSPHDSAQDSFLTFMRVLDDLRARVRAVERDPTRQTGSKTVRETTP